MTTADARQQAIEAAFERLVNDLERSNVTVAHDAQRDIAIVRSALSAGLIRETEPLGLDTKIPLDLEDGGWYGGVTIRQIVRRAEKAESKVRELERVIRETDNTGDDASDDEVFERNYDGPRGDDSPEDYLIYRDAKAWFEFGVKHGRLARSSGVADTPKNLDPLPFVNPTIEPDYAVPVGFRYSYPVNFEYGDGRSYFRPRPEFEQDESKYPHMQGVADTVKEGNNDE